MLAQANDSVYGLCNFQFDKDTTFIDKRHGVRDFKTVDTRTRQASETLETCQGKLGKRLSLYLPQRFTVIEYTFMFSN